MTSLILTSDLYDLWMALTQCHSFAEYLSAREGVRYTHRSVFGALLVVQPWRSEHKSYAAWRAVRDYSDHE